MRDYSSLRLVLEHFKVSSLHDVPSNFIILGRDVDASLKKVHLFLKIFLTVVFRLFVCVKSTSSRQPLATPPLVIGTSTFTKFTARTLTLTVPSTTRT